MFKPSPADNFFLKQMRIQTDGPARKFEDSLTPEQRIVIGKAIADGTLQEPEDVTPFTVPATTEYRPWAFMAIGNGATVCVIDNKPCWGRTHGPVPEVLTEKGWLPLPVALRVDLVIFGMADRCVNDATRHMITHHAPDVAPSWTRNQVMQTARADREARAMQLEERVKTPAQIAVDEEDRYPVTPRRKVNWRAVLVYSGLGVLWAAVVYGLLNYFEV